MKITFLGSSHGVPAADRYCSSLMVEVNGSVYIIDTGAPLIDCLLRHGKLPKDVKAILYTHAHSDHVSGIFQYLDLLQWYYREDSVDIYMTEQRVLGGIQAYLNAMFGHYCEERIRFSVVPSDFVFDDGSLKVTYIPTKHILKGELPSYAMLLEADGKKVLVTGDLSQNLGESDFPAVAAEIETDAVICEMAHFGVSKVQPYLETCKTKQFWFTHVYPYKRFDDIRAVENDYPFSIHIARDDDEIVL
jgi:ribonuclease BN (tRNA processing enzyme)